MGSRWCWLGGRAAPISASFTTLLLMSLLLSGILTSVASSPLRAPRDIIARPNQAHLSSSSSSSSTKMQSLTTNAALQAVTLRAVRDLVHVIAYPGHTQPFKLPADTFSKSLDELIITVTLLNGSALPRDYLVTIWPPGREIVVHAGPNDVGTHNLLISAALGSYDGFGDSTESAQVRLRVDVEAEPDAVPHSALGVSHFGHITESAQTRIRMDVKAAPDPATGASQSLQLGPTNLGPTTLSTSGGHSLPTAANQPHRATGSSQMAAAAAAERLQPALNTASKADGLFLKVVVPVVCIFLLVVASVMIVKCCRSTAKLVSGEANGAFVGKATVFASSTLLVQNEDKTLVPPPLVEYDLHFRQWLWQQRHR